MRRYADLAEISLASIPDIRVQRINLAPSIPARYRQLPAAIKTLWHHAMVAQNARRVSRRRDVDLFHVIDGSHGYIASYLPPGRTVATVHDVIPWLQCKGRFPVTPPSRAARWVIDHAIHGLTAASVLVCDSLATETDLHTANPDVRGRTRIVYPPLEPAFHKGSDDVATASSSEPFVFHIGNNAFYKNRQGVLEIFSRIASSIPHRLIMAGAMPTESMMSFARSQGIEKRVDFVVNPNDSQVRFYYQNAKLFLFPSRYEGFGWPPLEAMASGCPVVCSTAGSLGEVVGSAALTASPDNVDEMARYSIQMLRDLSVAETYRSRGIIRAADFTTDLFGQSLSAIYRQVCGAACTHRESGIC